MSKVEQAQLGGQQEDAAPPSLAVMAYEEKGEIHFIALHTGGEGRVWPARRLNRPIRQPAGKVAGPGSSPAKAAKCAALPWRPARQETRGMAPGGVQGGLEHALSRTLAGATDQSRLIQSVELGCIVVKQGALLVLAEGGDNLLEGTINLLRTAM